MIGELPRRDARERQILCKAIEAFADHGVRGTSLRDIARNAKVSLTLISHHFGNKTSLVAAAVEQIRLTSTPALARLQARLEGSPHGDGARLAQAWVDYMHDAFGSQDALLHLRLMHRLSTDQSLDPRARSSLDVAEPVLRRALTTIAPDAADAAVDLVFEASRCALMTSLLKDAEDSADDSTARRARRGLLVDYISGAVDATLGNGRKLT